MSYTSILTFGFINLTLWESLPEGLITISFYAKDKAGNIGINQVIIIKDLPDEEPEPVIFGYDVFIMICIISLASLLISKRNKVSTNF